MFKTNFKIKKIKPIVSASVTTIKAIKPKKSDVTIPSNFNLGYACICNCLRDQNIFSSRTLRLDTLKSKGNKQHTISYTSLYI
jgi:hypothetical protein